jgi:hypothetical protein
LQDSVYPFGKTGLLLATDMRNLLLLLLQKPLQTFIVVVFFGLPVAV